MNDRNIRSKSSQIFSFWNQVKSPFLLWFSFVFFRCLGCHPFFVILVVPIGQWMPQQVDLGGAVVEDSHGEPTEVKSKEIKKHNMLFTCDVCVYIYIISYHINSYHIISFIIYTYPHTLITIYILQS